MTIDLATATTGPFQYVPVPNEHVPAVIAFLAQEMATSASSALEAEGSADTTWTDEELARLLDMGTDTAARLKKVLSRLARNPGMAEALSTRELAVALDLTYHQMKNHPTQVKRTLGKHFPGHGAPWSATPGLQFSPARSDELYYWLTPDRAAQVQRLLG